MRVDALSIRLRPRTNYEATDLGVRFCQSIAPSVYGCYAWVALPVMALSIATVEITTWLPGLTLWMAKPWLDRTILFVLSRAAFGESTTPADLWREKRHVFGGQILRTWIFQRLSLWRSLTQPVLQLEGLKGAELRQRIRQICHGRRNTAMFVTSAFALCETLLMVALLSLAVWFAPQGHEPDISAVIFGEDAMLESVLLAVPYAMAVLFLEPFYVASGFALYINRRVELEAWDLEQEFRRAFVR